jgi:hypothetical protein
MTVSVEFDYPRELIRNANISKMIWNTALFVRDLWIARSPNGSGGYIKGLTSPGSVSVSNGKIRIINKCSYAQYVESGHRQFNLGMAILNGGKGVKRSKEGFKYKIIFVKQTPKAKFRQPSVGASITKAFAKGVPKMVKASLQRYGALTKYQANKRIRKPLKSGKPRSNAMKGFFVISEKAIKDDPSKWMSPQVPGRFLAKRVQKEAERYVQAAIDEAVKSEQQRMDRTKVRKPVSVRR